MVSRSTQVSLLCSILKFPYLSHIFRHPRGRRLWRTCIPKPHRQRLWADFDLHHYRYQQSYANVPLPFASTPASEHHQSPGSFDLGPDSSPESSSNLLLGPVSWPVPLCYFLTRERWSARLYSPPPLCSTGSVFSTSLDAQTLTSYPRHPGCLSEPSNGFWTRGSWFVPRHL